MPYPLNIGEAAQAAGVTTKMIRHYEGMGLIAQAARTDSGYRQYTANDVAVLRFIRQSRTMGFSTKQIGELLALWSDAHRESREVKALASRHIADLDEKMREIAQMKAMLERLSGDCRGDEGSHCPILEELGGKATATVPRPPAKPRPARTSAAKQSDRPSDASGAHTGLVAWMHGRTAMAPRALA